MNRLKDKVCIVTGASGGIGACTAIKFAKEGAIVYAVDIRPRELAELCAKCDGTKLNKCDGFPKEKMAGEVRYKVMDVTKLADVEKALAEIHAETKRIDVLVNNAGITKDATLAKMTEEQFDAVINVNLKGVFNMGKAASKYMVERQSGSIINTSSIVGVYGNYGQTNYAATKAGLIGMSKTWARELGKKGIRVNAVAPGFTKTEMLETVPEKVITMLIEKTPMARLGQPEDIANLYAFLASDESSFITGQVIGIDGGLVI
ncbi:MAG TPA: beta-ketoacyl-ACP reductase [Candidatus Wallbacteria bacterium]|nr:beta-ketoacyl-ACP reductase [Candidatus Wallbacteria bacterium]